MNLGTYRYKAAVVLVLSHFSPLCVIEYGSQVMNNTPPPKKKKKKKKKEEEKEKTTTSVTNVTCH